MQPSPAGTHSGFHTADQSPLVCATTGAVAGVDADAVAAAAWDEVFSCAALPLPLPLSSAVGLADIAL